MIYNITHCIVIFINYIKKWCVRTNCRVVYAMENGVMENARNHGCKRDVWQLVVIGQSAAATKWVTSDATNWSRTVSVAWRSLVAAKKLVENANNNKLKSRMQKKLFGLGKCSIILLQTTKIILYFMLTK